MNLFEYIGHYRALPVLLCLGISVNPASAMADGELPDAAATTASPTSSAVATAIPTMQIVALVNGKPITVREFDARYNTILRERFYHGKPPESQEDAVRKEVVDFLVENELLFEEAEKRGLKPDNAVYEKVAAAMEARYGAVPEWQRDRKRVLSETKNQVDRQSLIEQVKKVLQEIPQPAPNEVRAYYEQKPALFTEPEKVRLSVILLKTDPGDPEAAAKAREVAQGIYLRLKGGADFAELARQYSEDNSAKHGGELGFVHGGMLPEMLQGVTDKLQVGEVTMPIRVLEGVALYRLNERVASVLQEFAAVEPRALGLLKKELQEQAWKEAISRLRRNAKIEIFAPMANSGNN